MQRIAKHIDLFTATKEKFSSFTHGKMMSSDVGIFFFFFLFSIDLRIRSMRLHYILFLTLHQQIWGKFTFWHQST